MRSSIILLFAAASLWACSPATLTADDVPVTGAGGPDVVQPPPGNQQGEPQVPPPGGEPDPGMDPGVEPDPPAPPPPPPLQIVIEEPPRGHRQSTGPVQVVGRVLNGPVASLTVAGAEVVPDAEGYFSTDVAADQGLHTVVTAASTSDGRQAEDRRGILVGADADPGLEVERSLQVLITADGLNQLNDLLSGFVGGLDIDSLIAGQDAGEFRVTRVDYDDVTMRLVPRAGHLELRLTIHQLHIEMEGEFEIVFVPVGVSGTMDTNALYIDAEMHLNPTPDGGLDLALRNPRVEFEGFDYNIRNVPGFIEGLFEGTVRGTAEDAIRDALNDQVLPELFDPAALSQEIDVLGRTVQLATLIRGVDVSFDGLMLTLGAQANTLDPVRAGNALPIDMTPADMSYSDPIDLAMSADFIGRILHALWAAGALDLEMGPGTDIDLPGGLPLLIGSLDQAASGIDPSSDLVIRARPLLQPVAYVDEGEKPLVIEMADMMLDLTVPDVGTLATVAVHLTMRLSMGIDTSGGEIAFVPEIDVEAHCDVAETPRGPVKDIDLERQVCLAMRLIPGAVANETFSLGADALPVPFLLTNARFEPDLGSSWVHVRADIETVDPAAPPPAQ